MNRRVDGASRHGCAPVAKARCLSLCVSVTLALAALPAEAMRTSTNFSIDAETVSAGGTTSTSTSFQLAPSVGQTSPVGTAASTNFALLSGFSYQALQVQPDTDMDGIPDSYENANGLDPNVNDAGLDPDLDGLTNLQEFQNGTFAQDSDTDNDLMPDGFEVNNMLNPLNAGDALADADADGFTNLKEFQDGTDPQNASDNVAVRALPAILQMTLEPN